MKARTTSAMRRRDVVRVVPAVASECAWWYMRDMIPHV